MDIDFYDRDYDYYVSQQTIQDINVLEKHDIISFLRTTYKDNIKAAQFNLEDFPRWSIISVYYAMHDISRLYLAIKYDIKFTKPSVHDAVIKALKKLVDKKEIICLIDKGNEEFRKIQRLDYFLAKGKYNREKIQYYNIDSFDFKKIKFFVKDFLDTVVLHYIDILEKLIDNFEKLNNSQKIPSKSSNFKSSQSSSHKISTLHDNQRFSGAKEFGISKSSIEKAEEGILK